MIFLIVVVCFINSYRCIGGKPYLLFRFNSLSDDLKKNDTQKLHKRASMLQWILLTFSKVLSPRLAYLTYAWVQDVGFRYMCIGRRNTDVLLSQLCRSFSETIPLIL